MAVRGEWSAIESHRAVAAVAVGRDDWVILKIVDGNDAGAIIKPRSMPRQSWRVISACVPRIDAWGESREECRERGTRGSFSSEFSAESDKDELAQQSRLAGSIHHGCRDCHSIACRSIIELGTRADLEEFIRQIIRSREISELHSDCGSEGNFETNRR